MRINIKRMMNILGLALIALTITACIPQRVAVEKTKIVQVITMNLNDKESSKLTQDGITIKVKAVYPDNSSQYAALTSKINYWKYQKDRYGNKIQYTNGSYATFKRSMSLNLLAFPAFEVKITNTTKHVLRFSTAVIAVEDDKGNTYDGLMKNELNDYLEESIKSQLKENYYFYTDSKTNLKKDIRKIRLLDNNLKVLPGKTVKAYVAVNYGQYSIEESKQYLLDQEKLTLSIYEVPSKVNQAGVPTKTTNFNFVFDIDIKEKEKKYTVYQYK